MPKERFTLILDSSQISQYLECAEQWNLSHNEKLIPTSVALQQPKDAMNAGTLGHKLLEIWYSTRRRGASINDAFAAMVAYNPDTDTCECGCNITDHKYIDILKTYECKKCGHCAKWRPRPFELSAEDRVTVHNKVRDYAFKYQNNDFVALRPDSVEVGFSETIYEDSDNLFILEGRIDLIGQIQNLNCIVDHKFQKRRHDLYAKAVQFRNYALVAKTTLLFINYIRLAQRVDDSTFVRVPVNFTVPELLWWKNELIKIYFRVKNDLINKSFDKNYGSCMGKYNYTCQYTSLCEEIHPTIKENKKNTLYTIKPVEWRPW